MPKAKRGREAFGTIIIKWTGYSSDAMNYKPEGIILVPRGRAEVGLDNNEGECNHRQSNEENRERKVARPPTNEFLHQSFRSCKIAQAALDRGLLIFRVLTHEAESPSSLSLPLSSHGSLSPTTFFLRLLRRSRRLHLEVLSCSLLVVVSLERRQNLPPWLRR